jgi:hypothetical protein
VTRVRPWWLAPLLRYGAGGILAAIFFGLYTGHIESPQTVALETTNRLLRRQLRVLTELCRQHATTDLARVQCEAEP